MINCLTVTFSPILRLRGFVLFWSGQIKQLPVWTLHPKLIYTLYLLLVTVCSYPPFEEVSLCCWTSHVNRLPVLLVAAVKRPLCSTPTVFRRPLTSGPGISPSRSSKYHLKFGMERGGWHQLTAVLLCIQNIRDGSCISLSIGRHFRSLPRKVCGVSELWCDICVTEIYRLCGVVFVYFLFFFLITVIFYFSIVRADKLPSVNALLCLHVWSRIGHTPHFRHFRRRWSTWTCSCRTMTFVLYVFAKERFALYNVCLSTTIIINKWMNN